MAAGEEADEGIMRSRPAAACWLSKASRWHIEGIGGIRGSWSAASKGSGEIVLLKTEDSIGLGRKKGKRWWSPVRLGSEHREVGPQVRAVAMESP